jgi:hypothetical protein
MKNKKLEECLITENKTIKFSVSSITKDKRISLKGAQKTDRNKNKN